MTADEELSKGCRFIEEGKFDEAKKIFLKMARKSIPEAQFNLALMYQDGKGVPRSMKKAAKWYTKAADNGMDEALLNLGCMYLLGNGVPTSEKKAFDLVQKAADNGYGKAQIQLGVIQALLPQQSGCP